MTDTQTTNGLNMFWEVQDSLYKVAMNDSINIKNYREFPRLTTLLLAGEQNTLQTSEFEILNLNAD